MHQRNLEARLDVSVRTKTDVILEIFQRNALTKEGKIQVELARLRYILPRLTGVGLYLSNPGGGIGTRGPGERITEREKTHIRRRIRLLQYEIEKIRRARRTSARLRQKRNLFTAALVGYTNVGKTSIFNLLSRSSVLVADKYFATLDPTIRRLTLKPAAQSGDNLDRGILLIDTVGFIEDLPEELLTAFKATVEVLEQADLLIHVADITDPYLEEHLESDIAILAKLGLEGLPRITVFNKCDLIGKNGIRDSLGLDRTPEQMMDRLRQDYEPAYFVSVPERRGIDELIEHIVYLNSISVKI